MSAVTNDGQRKGKRLTRPRSATHFDDRNGSESEMLNARQTSLSTLEGSKEFYPPNIPAALEALSCSVGLSVSIYIRKLKHRKLKETYRSQRGKKCRPNKGTPWGTQRERMKRKRDSDGSAEAPTAQPSHPAENGPSGIQGAYIGA